MADPQITREEIERIRALPKLMLVSGHYRISDLLDVAKHALDEPERIAQAERRGAEAMREAAARWLLDREELIRARARSSANAAWRHKQQTAADHIEIASVRIRSLPLPDAPAEVDRIEAARRAGEAAGIERAAQWHDDRIPGELVMGMNSAANADRAAADAIRSLTSAPASSDKVAAEPSAPVAPQSRAELEAIRDASVAWKEDHATMESLRSRFPWLDKHYADETGVSDFKVIEARIAALEAVVAALREGLRAIMRREDASLRPNKYDMATGDTATESAIHLLSIDDPDRQAVRDTVEYLRDLGAAIDEARALLQGQGGDDGKA